MKNEIKKLMDYHLSIETNDLRACLKNKEMVSEKIEGLFKKYKNKPDKPLQLIVDPHVFIGLKDGALEVLTLLTVVDLRQEIIIHSPSINTPLFMYVVAVRIKPDGYAVALRFKEKASQVEQNRK